MDIDDLTLGQIKQLTSMCGTEKSHPLIGKKVVVVIPHGFIHFGILGVEGGVYKLTDASNLRYWKQRDGGLSEFAKKGPIPGDMIDKIDEAFIESVLFMYECGDWSE